jgi:hypothetical protein
VSWRSITTSGQFDLLRQQAYYRDCLRAGRAPEPYESVPDMWDPLGLPGKRGFDTAHRALASSVEAVVGDFMNVDLDESFDIVLFLGVL